MAKLNERSWTDDQLIESIKNAENYHQLATKMGLKRINRTVLRRLRELGLDQSKLKKQAQNRYNRLACHYNKEIIEKVVKESLSYSQVLMTLGVKPIGGNFATLKKKLNQYGINTLHFTGQRWNKDRTLKDSAKKYSTKGGRRNHLIVKRGERCQICNLEKWQDKKLSFEIHHIDGNRFNNEDDNLQILCPNCHSQTPNFRNKKRKKIESAG